MDDYGTKGLCERNNRIETFVIDLENVFATQWKRCTWLWRREGIILITVVRIWWDLCPTIITLILLSLYLDFWPIIAHYESWSFEWKIGVWLGGWIVANYYRNSYSKNLFNPTELNILYRRIVTTTIIGICTNTWTLFEIEKNLKSKYIAGSTNGACNKYI